VNTTKTHTKHAVMLKISDWLSFSASEVTTKRRYTNLLLFIYYYYSMFIIFYVSRLEFCTL